MSRTGCVCDEHDGSLPVDENEVALVEQSIAFKFLGEAFEELFLRGAEKIFQGSHAGTSSARQLGQKSPTIKSLWKSSSHSEHRL